MKAATLLILSVLATTGCATLGSVQGGPAITPSDDDASSASPTMTDPFASTEPNTSPQLIIPATGGPPVIGIPLGGDLFLPVTGGAPVPGISTDP
jgi:hypothetical protein